MKIFMLILIPALVLTFFLWASYPWQMGEKKLNLKIKKVISEDKLHDEQEDESVVLLKMITLNLSFLYGNGSEGDRYVHRESDFFEQKILQLIETLKPRRPDIVLLQEVDFSCQRSGYQDQAEILAKKLGLPYVAKITSWEANYIPFPYWPVKNHFGKMNSGGAILSRFPLSEHEGLLFSKPSTQSWWYNLFYLYRYFHKVTVHLGEKKINIINLHLEAFDKEERLKHIQKLLGYLETHSVDFVGGDFNMLPSRALKKSDLSPNDDYENDLSYDLMKKGPLLDTAPSHIYAASEEDYFTFPSWGPDRKLDYIWYHKDFKLMNIETLKWTQEISDHLPLEATFQIGQPVINPFSQ